MQNKAQKWVFAALTELRQALPFPLRGIDSDNGVEFINDHLLCCCTREKSIFTHVNRSGSTGDLDGSGSGTTSADTRFGMPLTSKNR